MSDSTWRLLAPMGYIFLSIFGLRTFDFDPGAKRTECWSTEEWVVAGVCASGVLIGVILEIYALIRFRTSLRCGCRCRNDGQEAQSNVFAYILATILSVIIALCHNFSYLLNTAPDSSVDCTGAMVPIAPVVGSVAWTALFALVTFVIVSGGQPYQRIPSSFGEQEMGYPRSATIDDGPVVKYPKEETEMEDAELEMGREDI